MQVLYQLSQPPGKAFQDSRTAPDDRRTGDILKGVEPEDLGQRVPGPLPVGQGHLVRGRRDQVSLDGGGQDDGPGPVVDRSPLDGLLELDRRLPLGLGRQLVVLVDLPPQEAAEERGADDQEDDQDEQEAAARIGPSEHRSIG